jgi:trk system potassium uptake protein TrkH
MLLFLTRLPFFVLLMGIGSLAMLVPVSHALVREDGATAMTFFFGAIVGAMLTLLIGLATRGYRPKSIARSHLTALLAAFSLLPVLFALPFHEAIRTISFLDAWFEMLSSFTTTGATLFDNPARLNPTLHLWRALVGWLGGLLVWVMAVSILAPLNLGGFEVRTGIVATGRMREEGPGSRYGDASDRLARLGLRLVPIYGGLTLVLWTLLVLAGEGGFVAACHAMSVMATSGISPIGGIERSTAGIGTEMVMFIFLFFALSRLSFSRGIMGRESGRLIDDPEVRMGIAFLTIVTAVLILRHFVVVAENALPTGLNEGLAAFWGSMFTVMSFMTTTGFESRHWLGAADWSGLTTPGLVLVGLALVGGGVATTAGGVKLLRVYALYKHGLRELERLVHPSSVGGAGAEERRIRREGAFISWIFFMLFALSITVVMLLLSLTGVQFETAMVLAVAAISTTGPLAQVAAENPISYAGIPEPAQMVLMAAMVLGRLETLALIALFNLEFWRN